MIFSLRNIPGYTAHAALAWLFFERMIVRGERGLS